MAYDKNVSFGEVQNMYSKHHRGKGSKQKLESAYKYADEKHTGMLRGTGEPYINHALRTARMVAEWGFESDVVIAALLHDVVEDCNTPLTEISVKFGPAVSKLVGAVTELSIPDQNGQPLTVRQKDRQNDIWLQKNMNSKALYVKIADRIDNLNTLDGVPEPKRIPKAEHTRDILLPMVELQKAWRFVDVLEELCFRAEHTTKYEALSRQFKKIQRENESAYEKTLNTLRTVFAPGNNLEGSELEHYHHFLRGLLCEPRSLVSIYRQLCPHIDNIKEDWLPCFSKHTVALYNLTILVSDELRGTDLKDLFFTYYEKSLSQKGFYPVDYRTTTHKDSSYIVVEDEMHNLYRIFIKTETEYQRYLYGSIIDTDSSFALPTINETEPRETYNEQIKVFKRNGDPLYIDKGATVLDFAFAVHTDLGYHFGHAQVDDTRTKLPPYTRLNEGDTITIVDNPDVRPGIAWFKYVKTSKAVHQLVQYFKEQEKEQDKEIENLRAALQAVLQALTEEIQKNEQNKEE